MTLIAILCLWAASITPIPPGATYEVAWSPKRGSLDLVVRSIGEARSEILVAAYGLTSKPIAQALVAAKARGVSVRVVADKGSNGRKYTAATFLANQGIEVRLDGRYSIHHHKFLVIDRQTVETGSFNFTEAAATRNAENVLVLRGVSGLALAYAKEWDRLWNESVPLAAKY